MREFGSRGRYCEPVQVLASRGDLLLAHFPLGHNFGGNMSDRTRRIVYYRLSCPGHVSRWADTFTAAFTEYEPVRRALNATALTTPRRRQRGHPNRGPTPSQFGGRARMILIDGSVDL